MTQELAQLLGRDGASLPRIRKTDEHPPCYSIVGAVMATKGFSSCHAKQGYEWLRRRYGDDIANCDPVNFRDGCGRASEHWTSVAPIERVLEITVLLTGSKAAGRTGGASRSGAEFERWRRSGRARPPARPQRAAKRILVHIPTRHFDSARR